MIRTIDLLRAHHLTETALHNPFLTRNTRRKIEEAQKLWITDQGTEDHTDDE